jgi:hypothetical protein
MVAHPRRWAAAVLTPLVFGILLAGVQTAAAAVQLNFFNVIAFPSSVTLEWSTASEVNLAGFDIQCKQADEPDTAFHEIGFQRAKGGPNVGALYNFPVTSGLVPGVSYCFRLKEITTDGSPGEVFDRCGYGAMVTPTPGLGAIPIFTPVPVQTDAFGNPIIPTPTIPVVATDAFGNPILPTPILQPNSPLPVPQPFATDAFGNPIPPTPLPQPFATDAFGNPIPPAPTVAAVATDAFGNPIPQPNSPLPPPSVPASASGAGYDAYGNPLAANPAAYDAYGNPLPAAPQQYYDAFRNPLTPEQVALASEVYDINGNPLPKPTATLPPAAAASMAPQQYYDAFGNALTPEQAAVAPQVYDAFGTLLPTPPSQVSQSGLAQNPAEPALVAAATPTVAYVVVTATPTPAPVALAPVLTPLPTTTPQPAGMQLAASLDQGGQNLTQNLMVMLLCLTFTGASGIGILGLITSVMFMRSRTSQRDFYERTSVRRRY